MFEVLKTYYDLASAKAREQEWDADDKAEFVHDMVLEQSQKFAQELANLGKAADERFAELNSLCDSIAVKQAIWTADVLHRNRTGFSNAARQTVKGGLFNRAYLVLWTAKMTFDEASATTRLVNEGLHKEASQSETEAGLQYLRTKQQDFAPPEKVQEAIKVLEEIQSLQPSTDQGFSLIRKFIEDYLELQPTDFLGKTESTPVREMVYTFVMNTAADFAESGRYHIYRGVVNPRGPGEDLVRIFHWAQDELLKIGATDEDTVRRSKEAFERNLQSVG